MATGAYCDQLIWVQVGGGTTAVTLDTLYRAYLDGSIGKYRAWCFDPEEFQKPEEERGPMVYTMPIPYVTVHHMHQLTTVTTEDEDSVVVSADGGLVDAAEVPPLKDIYLAVHTPSETRCMVTALTEYGGQPGEKQIVRRVVTYAHGYGCVMTLPVPNMIAKCGFVIIA
ncbi:MAG: hypothetical protein NC489_09020 [Ruminococcus flavefaciens]|nr:hypothetical protein [Ruminococcus flavefaciens]